MTNKTTYVSPFIEAGIQAYIQWFTNEWTKYQPDKHRKLKGVLLGNVTDLRKAQDTLKSEGIKDLPRLHVAMARMELNGDRGGGAKRFHKINSMIDRDAGKSHVRTVVPVRVGLVTNFITDRADEVKLLSEAMLNNYPGTSFFFEDDVGFRMECRVFLDDGVDFPQQDISSPGDLYLVEPVVSMTNYIGTRTEVGIVREIRVRWKEATGSVITSVAVDAETGKTSPLLEHTVKYTDPFDKTSSQWKGI